MSASDQRTHASTHHILIVDDEEIVLVALRETLRQLGYRVSTAPDGVRGLALLQKEKFSVVITDHQMPKLTGLEFLAQVKAIQPDATRVLITAVLNLTTVIDAINRAEIFRFLLKPWQREDLLTTIQDAVRRREAIDRDRQALAAFQAESQALARRLEELERELDLRGKKCP